MKKLEEENRLLEASNAELKKALRANESLLSNQEEICGLRTEQVNDLTAENERLRAELNAVKSNLMASEEIAALRYAAMRELAERLERLQSPLVKETDKE